MSINSIVKVQQEAGICPSLRCANNELEDFIGKMRSIVAHAQTENTIFKPDGSVSCQIADDVTGSDDHYIHALPG